MDDGHSSTYSRRVVLPSATPFIYGIRHEGNLRAELLLSDPDTVIQHFIERKADIALLPFTAVPLLSDAHIVTRYCIGGVPSAREALLGGDDPAARGMEGVRRAALRLRRVGGARGIRIPIRSKPCSMR